MYAAIVLPVWNIDRFSAKLITLPGWAVLLYFMVLPLTVYFYAVANIKQRIKTKEEKVLASYVTKEEPGGMGDSVLD
jgi:hypothetical protein